jgi:dephospho-CoA kinase
MTPRSKTIIGLIGGIGAGKSAAAAALAQRGGFVVDCDKLGHLALDVPTVKADLREKWGNTIFHADGTVNRKALGAVVFGNEAQRKALEAIVFPVIGELTHEQISIAEQKPEFAFIVLDAATLLEAQWGSMCSKILYIDASRELRLQRVHARNGWNDAELTRREAAQLPADVKKSHAHAVIVNDGTTAQLQSHVDQLLNDWGFSHSMSST